jgi:hypothetical protein
VGSIEDCGHQENQWRRLLRNDGSKQSFLQVALANSSGLILPARHTQSLERELHNKLNEKDPLYEEIEHLIYQYASLRKAQ